MSIKGQGHSLTLVKGHSDFKVKCLTFGLYTQVSNSGPHGPLVLFSWPHYVLRMPKFNRSKSITRLTAANRHYYQFIYLYIEPFISTKLFKSSNTVAHPEVSIALSLWLPFCCIVQRTCAFFECKIMISFFRNQNKYLRFNRTRDVWK